MKLKLAKGLDLPVEVVTQKLGWIGTTGSGKTYGASKLAELMFEAHAQFVVLDPVGVWYGLRLAKDGKHPSTITIPIFGGLHGDVPLESTAGAMMADLIVDRSLTCILDVSQFESDAQKARFAADFADRFFFRKKAAPSAVHVFIEECQEFVPENQQRGEERMLHAFTRLQKIGRNFGIGTSLITQRPQETSKKALNLAQTLFVFRTTGSHERKAIESWIKDKAIAGQDIGQELPKLKTGAPHVWSPEWLDLSEVVQIHEKHSFNASATPEVGAAKVTRELAPIDLEKIRGEMAATIERAKADDPRELKKTIVSLHREIGELKKRPEILTPAVGKVVEKPALTDADRALIGKLDARLTELEIKMRTMRESCEATLKDRLNSAAAVYMESTRDRATAHAEELARILDTAGVKKLLEKLNGLAVTPMPAKPLPRTVTESVRYPQSGSALAPPPKMNGHRFTPSDNAEIGNTGLRRILIALAQRADGLTLRQIGIRAGLSSKSGTFSTYMSKGRQSGWIQDGGKGGRSTITDEGRTVLGAYDPLPSGRDLFNYWMQELGDSGASRILQAVVEAHPNTLTLEQIGERANLNSKSGTFSTYMSRLRTLELVESGRGWVKASDELFD